MSDILVFYFLLIPTFCVSCLFLVIWLSSVCFWVQKSIAAKRVEPGWISSIALLMSFNGCQWWFVSHLLQH